MTASTTHLKVIFMKPALTAAFLLMAMISAAHANECTDELAQVDQALSGEAVAADVKVQVKDMRNQAADLCKAGNETEGLDVLAEAKSMLGIE